MFYKERYAPTFVPISTTIALTGDQIGNFLCTTTGTITVLNGAGVTIINTHPVTAGTYYPLPYLLGPGGKATFTTNGTATGTLGV